MHSQSTIEQLMATRRFCYYISADSLVEGHGFRVSVVFEDEPGHYPMGNWPYDGSPSQKAPWFWGPDYKAAVQTCEEQNERMGLTKVDVFKITLSSMNAGRKPSMSTHPGSTRTRGGSPRRSRTTGGAR